MNNVYRFLIFLFFFPKRLDVFFIIIIYLNIKLIWYCPLYSHSQACSLTGSEVLLMDMRLPVTSFLLLIRSKGTSAGGTKLAFVDCVLIQADWATVTQHHNNTFIISSTDSSPFTFTLLTPHTAQLFTRHLLTLIKKLLNKFFLESNAVLFFFFFIKLL